MKNLSRRLNNFDEYIFAKLARRARAVAQKTGRKILDLSVGSPDFAPSEKLLSALKKFIEEKNAHLYPGYGATEEFSATVRSYYKRRFGVEIANEQVRPLLGAKDGIAHLIMAMLDEGDEFLTPDPGYPGFTGPALMLGAKPVFYSLKKENNFKPDIKELQRLVTKKTKFIWLNFPSNPTGAAADLAELKKYAAFAKKNKLFVFYDNAYAEMYYGKTPPPSFLQIKGADKYAVEIHSLSKTFSLAGCRIGFAAGNKEILSALSKVKSQTDSGLSLPLQRLAAYALTKPDNAWRRAMLKSYKARRDILAKIFKNMGLKFTVPDYALYIWAEVPPAFKDGEKFAVWLLEEKQTLVTPGSAFGAGGRNFVRISFCSDIKNIKEYL